MPVFYCVHCGQPIDADESLAGQQVGCPGCRSVVTVPDASPYQPPALAHSPPLPQTQRRMPRGKAVLWVPLAATAVTFGVCLIKKMSTPPSALDTMLGNTGVANQIAGAVGLALAAGVIAGLIALVIAGIAAAFKRSFLATLAYCYSGTLLLCAALLLVGPLVSPAPRSHASSEAQAKLSPVEAQQTREFLDGIEADLQSNTPSDQSARKKTGPKRGEAKKDVPPPSGNADLDALRRLTQEYTAALAALQKEYEAELAAQDFTRLLDAAQVAADSDFSQSHAMLDSIRKVVGDYRQKMAAGIRTYPDRIKASDLSLGGKAAALREAGAGVQDALDTFNQVWDIEEEIVETFASVIKLLESRRGHWRVEGSGILFDDLADSTQYSALLATVQHGTQLQEKVRQKAKDKGTQALKELRKSVSE